MNPDYEQKLEKQIDQELKALPELRAPDSLAPRVMALIDSRSAVPWYLGGWQNWAFALRWSFLAALAIGFAGLCYAAALLAHAAPVSMAIQRVETWLTGLSAVGRTLDALWGSACTVARNASPACLFAVLFGLALGYALFLGLGTVYVRVALAATKPSRFQQ